MNPKKIELTIYPKADKDDEVYDVIHGWLQIDERINDYKIKSFEWIPDEEEKSPKSGKKSD